MKGQQHGENRYAHEQPEPDRAAAEEKAGESYDRQGHGAPTDRYSEGGKRVSRRRPCHREGAHHQRLCHPDAQEWHLEHFQLGAEPHDIWRGQIPLAEFELCARLQQQL